MENHFNIKIVHRWPLKYNTHDCKMQICLCCAAAPGVPPASPVAGMQNK